GPPGLGPSPPPGPPGSFSPGGRAPRGTPTAGSGGGGHGVLGPRGAPAGSTTTSAVLLAHAQTCRTTAVATAWLAAGYSPACIDPAALPAGATAHHERERTPGSAPACRARGRANRQ